MLSSVMSSKQRDFNSQDCIICTKNEKINPPFWKQRAGLILLFLHSIADTTDSFDIAGLSSNINLTT